jgi:hypothetical protein
MVSGQKDWGTLGIKKLRKCGVIILGYVTVTKFTGERKGTDYKKSIHHSTQKTWKVPVLQLISQEILPVWHCITTFPFHRSLHLELRFLFPIISDI